MEEPDPGLQDLVSQWSAGDFSAVPPVVLLSSADMQGALGAYAISAGTIYLNADGILRSWKPGTTGVDLLTGSTSDQFFSPGGVPAAGGSGNLYANAKDADYLLIDGFNPSNDQLLVASGKAYGTAPITLAGTTGMGVFEDRNGDGLYTSSSDDLLALLKGLSSYPASSLLLG